MNVREALLIVSKTNELSMLRVAAAVLAGEVTRFQVGIVDALKEAPIDRDKLVELLCQNISSPNT